MLKIVVVEDEEFVRKGIVLTIDWAALGCVIAGEAADGKAGLELIRLVKPDIIIIDIKMPYMTGIEMLTQLRQEGNQVKAVILTAYSDFLYAQQAVKLGAVDYLLKPFHDEELENVIKKITLNLKNPADGEEEGSPAENELSAGIENVCKAGRQSKYVTATVEYIADHYSDSNTTILTIAEALKLSKGHLSHTFKNVTGCTIADYLTKYRMHKAIEMLKDCRNRVGEVAEAVGYRDFAYFSYTFKKIIGLSPSEFQAK